MKIKLMTDRATFDQSATCTDLQLDASLDGYESTVRTMILRAYPDADIEHYRSIREYGAPSGSVSVDGSCHTVQSMDIQAICEDVYATGQFWDIS
jgi:hypothetical protein